MWRLLLVGIWLGCAPVWAREGAARVGAGDWTEASLRVGTLERWYRVYRPRDLPARSPVVVLLHGGTQSMRKLFTPRAGGTRAWPDLADREQFLLVVPNGVNRETGDTRGDQQNWNDLRPAGSDRESEADDVTFLLQLLDEVQRTAQTDPRRVYVTGASNGGMLTFRLLIEAPERFAAGAAFIAALPQGVSLPTPAQPTPLLIANGTEDPLVAWAGGAMRGGRGKLLSVPDTLDWWIRANHAERTGAREERLPDHDRRDECRIVRIRYPANSAGAPVEFLKIIGGGHALPSRQHELPDSRLVRRMIGPLCRDAEGAELAWEFFKPFTR